MYNSQLLRLVTALRGKVQKYSKLFLSEVQRVNEKRGNAARACDFGI